MSDHWLQLCIFHYYRYGWQWQIGEIVWLKRDLTSSDMIWPGLILCCYPHYLSFSCPCALFFPVGCPFIHALQLINCLQTGSHCSNKYIWVLFCVRKPCWCSVCFGYLMFTVWVLDLMSEIVLYNST